MSRKRTFNFRTGLSNLIAFFTANWGLKLLSLALAIIIYMALSQGSGNNSKTTKHETKLFQRS